MMEKLIDGYRSIVREVILPTMAEKVEIQSATTQCQPLPAISVLTGPGKMPLLGIDSRFHRQRPALLDLFKETVLLRLGKKMKTTRRCRGNFF